MKKQEHLTEYLPGYIGPDGEFHRSMWAGKTRNVDDACEEAREYAQDGMETLANFGVDAVLKPAVVTREVYHVESEPELV